MQTIQGKIVSFLQLQEGESQRGHWKKAGIVIEYGDEYPHKAAFSLFGDEKLQMCKGLAIGNNVQISYNPESREYQGRWYTELKCISIVAVIQANTAPVSAQPSAPAPAPAPTQNQAQSSQYSNMPEDTDLPF